MAGFRFRINDLPEEADEPRDSDHQALALIWVVTAGLLGNLLVHFLKKWRAGSRVFGSGCSQKFDSAVPML
jgi:hypothetical protein